MNRHWSAGFVAIGLAATTFLGCSKPAKQDAVVLQTTWKGAESGTPNAGQASLVFTGGSLEFHGANPAEWYKATYTLHEDTNPKQLVAVITDCPFQQYIGKTANAIYKVEGDTLTIASNEPGSPNFPASFTAQGVRCLVLKK